MASAALLTDIKLPRSGLRLAHPLLSRIGSLPKEYELPSLSARLPAGSIFDPTVQLQLFTYAHAKSGLATRVSRIERIVRDEDTDVLRQIVSGRIRQGTKEVGSFERAFELQDDGRLFVLHHHLILSEPYRGQGFGADFLARCERGYRQKDAAAIFTSAGDECGAYAWARLSFDFTTEEGRKAHHRIDRARGASNWWHESGGRPAARKLLAKGRLSAEDIALIERRLDEGLYQGSEPLSPLDVSELGRAESWETDSGERDWWGRRVLLGSSWEGIKILDPDTYYRRRAAKVPLIPAKFIV